MLWYGHDPNGWGWFMMAVGMIFFWSALIVLGVLLFRGLSRPAGTGTSTGPAQGPTAEQLLAERYARGEIDEDDYRRRLSVLHMGGSAGLHKN